MKLSPSDHFCQMTEKEVVNALRRSFIEGFATGGATVFIVCLFIGLYLS